MDNTNFDHLITGTTLNYVYYHFEILQCAMEFIALKVNEGFEMKIRKGTRSFKNKFIVKLTKK